MESIDSIPNPRNYKTGKSVGNYWEATDACSGFYVSEACPWRYEEMSLISYTPQECFNDDSLSCTDLVAYARYQHNTEQTKEAVSTFQITIFTITVLSVATMSFTRDIDNIVVYPIKKIVDIIQRLAEGPLKKSDPPKVNSIQTH